MKKHESDAKTVLKQLGKLSKFLADLEVGADNDHCFDVPLDIIRKTMMFDVSVLYKVSNVIENRLILEVVKVLDPNRLRLDLTEGRKLRLFLDNRDKRFINEVAAFSDKRESHINVPGMGCDIMGYVYLPDSFGGAYLFGGDFCGKESSIKDYEVSGVQIMCNFLSAILLKTRFEHQAEYDNLTGLFNSAKIKGQLDIQLKRFERKQESVASIAIGDIDFFKKVNDTYGHIQGDLVLKQVGRILSDSMRSVFDVAGRYGGEEFLLVFDETNQSQAQKIVERLRKTIETTRFPRIDKTGILENKYLNISMSFGIAVLDKQSDIQNTTDWIARADTALYQSKQNGRNQNSIFVKEN
ncbi:MAG: GGDEF domain-containing protein [Desulfobacula sp.]|nr:GGDEF domain-containing protein [Desulfobacula sp.]